MCPSLSSSRIRGKEVRPVFPARMPRPSHAGFSRREGKLAGHAAFSLLSLSQAILWDPPPDRETQQQQPLLPPPAREREAGKADEQLSLVLLLLLPLLACIQETRRRGRARFSTTGEQQKNSPLTLTHLHPRTHEHRADTQSTLSLSSSLEHEFFLPSPDPGTSSFARQWGL